MGLKGSVTDTVVTQISVGRFENYITAKMLLEYFEYNIGVVWRCRLKTFSTPPESFPDFNINTKDIQRTNTYGKVEPHAFVHFSSPYSARTALNAAKRGELILGKNPLKVSLGPAIPRSMNRMRRTKASFKLLDVRVEIGTWVSKDKFFVAWRGPGTGVDFLVDPFDGTCKFLFTKDTPFSFKSTRNHAMIKCNFKVEFLVRDIKHRKQYADSSHSIILLQLESSPMVYYRTADDDIEESVSFDLLDDDDPWIQTTDFTPSGAIGRCSTYRILIAPHSRQSIKLKKAMQYLTEQMGSSGNFSKQLQIRDEPDFGTPMSNPFFCIQFKEGVDFKILFLVNAVMHKGIFNQYQLSEEFFNLLRSQPEEVNLTALKRICSSKRSYFNAYGIMKLVQRRLVENPQLLERSRELDDIVEVRRLVITPTKAYCLPPEVELSNRVLRNYRSVADRFLRVTFMDEGMQPLNNNAVTYYPAPIVRDRSSHSNAQRTTVFRRVQEIVSQGFYLCGRKYSFLAFSANQLRDQSAWFFAEEKTTSVGAILKWMGHFTSKNVAKYAARMGQCFSSTYATVEVPQNEVDKLEDIERNGYVFSDGIGMISHDLAMEVAERLQLQVNPPSAYQIRYAGCKGVVAWWPDRKDGIRLSLRPSMNKFVSEHTILEICSWTRYLPGFLNRQIITLLSALNVCDDVFWEMQESMVYKLNRMLVNVDIALDVLTASCAEEGNTAAIMLNAGFSPQTEPHLRGMLTSIQAAQFGDLREKARIFVPSGRWLMGCLDELGILEQGQCFIKVSNPSLENCFAKHGSKFSETKYDIQVIKGYVVVAKNPCLHPGDVRILEAVDVPSLHHLFDCLVFPQKGDRPHSNEASGSDLDGDLYFVTWDEKLIPPSKRSWLPMEYAPPEVEELPRGVQHQDIIEFFTANMVNVSLGTICNAHVVHADISESGALDENCIKLAELAGMAVDFPKTGKIVNMPPELKPKFYPDFMGKEEFKSYRSNKILGKLYRQIKDDYYLDVTASSEIIFTPQNIPYDTDLEIPVSTTFVEEAWDLKCSYDEQLNGLLYQYKVNREDEVVTGHIWSMPKYSSRKPGEMKERLKNAYNALKKEFRKVFDHMGKDFDELSEDEKNTMFERRASAWYQVTYHPEWVKKSLELQDPDGGTETVMLSFPWIAADYLTQIKIKHGVAKDAQPAKLIMIS